MKGKVAEIMEAKYVDLSLWYNGKRIPEPFCLIDMGVPNNCTIIIEIAEGAIIGL